MTNLQLAILKMSVNITDEVSTWESIAERGYFDYKETWKVGTPFPTLIVGATAEYEEYADSTKVLQVFIHWHLENSSSRC